MSAPVLVIGAGIGGLSAALRLARAGVAVHVLEARAETGGLASGFSVDGVAFDGGPYVLLDRPGLEWAFAALGLELARELSLQRIEDVYEVRSPAAPPVRFHADVERTASGFESHWPGSGRAYRAFVARGAAAHAALSPALTVSKPGLRELLHGGAWRHAELLLRPLGAVLRRSGLPGPVQDAIAIWTHIAGQPLGEAPGFMALLPSRIHGAGAWYPAGGMASIPRVLARAAAEAGVRITPGLAVREIRTERGRATGVLTADGFLPASAVVSNAGLATYLDLLPGLSEAPRRKLRELPLQSPGVCAYLAADAPPRGFYMRFALPVDGDRCRLFVSPAALGASTLAARLMSPMDHATAESGGRPAQEAHLDRVLAEGWWREPLRSARVLARRVPADWGRDFRLHRDAMNPVMTARFAREGRLRHRSPLVRGLYLAGAATHPGQWVSFCAISGVLAADAVLADLA